MKNAREVAEALKEAVEDQTPVTTVIIGAAAFIAAIIYKFYPPEVRKQQTVAFANMVWEMVQNVMAEQGEEAEEEAEAEAEEPPKEWMQ